MLAGDGEKGLVRGLREVLGEEVLLLPVELEVWVKLGEGGQRGKAWCGVRVETWVGERGNIRDVRRRVGLKDKSWYDPHVSLVWRELTEEEEEVGRGRGRHAVADQIRERELHRIEVE